jgi:DNA helicase-2/ATP-dependent DNA helicase PcrA
MSFEPTEEQKAIVAAAKGTKDNLLINALAGAAKTTTLQLICEAITGLPILSLAFNKKIAVEMEKRLPSHVKSQTLNSIGHQVWMAAIGRRQANLDSRKTYNLFKEHVDGLSRADKSDAWEVMAEVQTLVRLMKTRGYIPKNAPPGNALISRHDFLDQLEEEPNDFAFQLAEALLTRSIKCAYDGFIDFDDQIYMPTLFGGTWPRFPLVLVDEAQDLSSLNHAMLRKLATTRLIAVGDPWQSIYGFRGAVNSGMSKLKRDFSMTEMTLSISFRCPKSIVARANRRVPHMRPAAWAKEGKVEQLDYLAMANIPDNAAIICRNNSPLFKLALQLIANGRGVQLIGADIGPALVKTLKKLGPESTSQQNVFTLINRWESEQLQKSKSPGSIADRAECLRVFAGTGPNLGAAIAYAEHLFSSHGPIQLLSGHKSKGLEWDIVYHLDPWRIPSQYATSPEEHEQELNVRYVIETRAKSELYLIDADNIHA